MTARDDLETGLLQGWKYHNRERAQLLIDAFAHELAERVRAIRITPSGHPSYDDGKDAGLDLAADTIDPEVTP